MRYTDRDALKVDVSGKQIGTIAAGLAAGAVLMYLFDPKKGAGRRTMASDTLRRAGTDATDTLLRAGRGASETVSGAVHNLSARGRAATENVRGRVLDWKEEASRFSHSSEPVEPLVEPPQAHRGSEVDWRTDAHGDKMPTPPTPPSAVSRLIPAALGAMVSPKAGGVAALVQALRDQTWNPRTRNTALLGGALGLYSLFAKRSPLTIGAGVVATALLAKGTKSAVAAANAADHARSGSAQSVQVEKTIRIDASPEQVFDLWTDYERFPHFMANVEEVRDLGADLSHWKVKGPGGKSYEWDSILTEKSRPHLLAWRSVPGAKVEQWGEVVLEPIRTGTKVTVRMTYLPPAGKAGQVMASLLGSNPKAQLEDDLERLKDLLERGAVAPLPEKSRSSFSRLWS